MFFDKISRKNDQSNDIVDYSFLQTQNKITEDGKEVDNNKNNLILISGTPEVLGPPSRSHWKPDSEVKACAACHRPFTFINRRHHCRRCGDIFCNQCASYTFRLDRNCKIDSKGVLSRVCRTCYNIYQKEFISLIRESDNRFKSRGGSSLYSREYNNYVPPAALHSSNTTANIPIIKTQPPRSDTTPATLMSVPSDWSWSTF
ncbi:FYVE-domain-containing protein [Anaeromyces robustus]|uniref:FYVE-domain-containing protein n=1 Tax=Anaeromyces robustus TaxID=1754192 RepID=A0A1Y1WT15_9FUNG|nr:FYVE-domain-containing protein [Anaeromyces robustus]|eukprot:ORX76689.1 FYVE-domain-containing protein [Anaeromyces robustus]